MTTKRAPRNRTIVLTDDIIEKYKNKLIRINNNIAIDEIINTTICQNTMDALRFFPEKSIDLIFADPPYNMVKSFNGRKFARKSHDDYEKWMEEWVELLSVVLKPNGSIYICGDWFSSSSIHRVMDKYFTIRNRITWEREKGRGAKKNWKNCSEDIWFCTASDEYIFNAEDVKVKRQVIAPYKQDGKPKDWEETKQGKFRTTSPSNLWTDLTVPFWSMPENTDHPTQKPEKLLAKIILASSNKGDIVLDPFSGSGTTSVTAKKLGRKFIGIEIEEAYCCLTEKRLQMVENNKTIQGYTNGAFWERNSKPSKKI